jgi:hypothetical protein
METNMEYKGYTIFADSSAIQDLENELPKRDIDFEWVMESYDPTIFINNIQYMVYGFDDYIMLCKVEN